jgi:hypothetical protein
LIEFEIYYNKPNPPLFFRQHNMRWTCNMVHSHFTLCLRARDYIERLSQHPWYGLWMRVKALHHYKVAALGTCVKWPLAKPYIGCPYPCSCSCPPMPMGFGWTWV